MLPENLFKDTIVLELASVLAGPSVGQFFAEQGATVIKVENHRAGGDVTRSWRMPDENNRVSAYFSSVNWGKKSIGVDLAEPEGQAVIHELVKKCSIVIASFRPGSAEKLAMDYNSLRNFNPYIIYGSISGYGNDSDRVGYDAIIQAESGYMYLNGTEEQPRKMPVAVMDLLAGHQLKQALLLAYINFLRTGEGCDVSISLIDAALTSLANQSANFLVGEQDPRPTGSLHPNIAPYGEIIETKDKKKIVLAIGSDKQFQRLCDVLGIPGIADDPAYAINTERIKNRTTLSKELAQAAAQLSAELLLVRARELHIPLGEIRTVGEALSQSAEALLIKKDGLTGIRTFAPSEPMALSAPPVMGKHTREVLTSLADLDAEKIDSLFRRKILG